MNDTKNTIEPILLYDINSLPEGVNFEMFADIWKKSRIALWDSGNGGQEPKVISLEDYEIKDVNNEIVK